jgi:hypothetical protein
MSEVIVQTHAGEHPLQILSLAVNLAAQRNIPVTTGPDPGVICISIHGAVRWARSHASGGVSPLGAAILDRQPQGGNLDRAEEQAVGQSRSWCEGFTQGCAAGAFERTKAEGLAGQLYRDGWMLGVEFRSALICGVCPTHNVRHPMAEPCPICEETAAAIERDRLPEAGK